MLDFAARAIPSGFDREQLALAIERGECVCWACPKRADKEHQALAPKPQSNNAMAEEVIDDAIQALERALDDLRELQ